MMDARAAKLALARKKLKDHQEKKLCSVQREDDCKTPEITHQNDHSVESVTKAEQYGQNILPEEKPAMPLMEFENKPVEIAKDDVKTDEIVQSFIAEATPPPQFDPGVNVTEILISNKRNLELQINTLQTKLAQFENDHTLAINNYNVATQKIHNLENELKSVHHNYVRCIEELKSKDAIINDLNTVKLSVMDEKNNLIEQLEFTKTILATKEMESNSLHSQLYNLQNQLEGTQLQLQQLTNGLTYTASNNKNDPQQNDVLTQKITLLEQQIKSMQKERDQINLHYEHYVAELNDQLKTVVKKNQDLTKQVDDLSQRESSLIEQIGEMEIRLQQIHDSKVQQPVVQQMTQQTVEEARNQNEFIELQQKYDRVQVTLNELSGKYSKLQKLYEESTAKVEELSQIKEADISQDISLSKLHADIASDKVAAQIATEQNKKLKQEMQGLEDVFVKMSKDKLELTEKLTAEKYLNRELTIKLAEIDEKAKDSYIKLKAKDEEMIRLLTNQRELERKLETVMRNGSHETSNGDTVKQGDCNSVHEHDHNHAHSHHDDHNHDHHSHGHTDHDHHNHDHTDHHHHHELCEQHESEETSLLPGVEKENSIPKEDAMLKLQDRFLKIMGEVADLSDEKHRLEHIILQLQNETDTICEYVALYQQQRSLLKKRDEERAAQIQMFQEECNKLRSQVEELTAILVRIAEDKELSSYFEMETRRNDLEKIMSLLANLKNNSLIDTKKQNSDFKNFHPCSCCSGQLIVV